MANAHTIRDPRNQAKSPPTPGDMNLSAPSQTMTGSTPASRDAGTRNDHAKGRDIGWLMTVLVFSCMALMPFIIAVMLVFGP